MTGAVVVVAAVERIEQFNFGGRGGGGGGKHLQFSIVEKKAQEVFDEWREDGGVGILCRVVPVEFGAFECFQQLQLWRLCLGGNGGGGGWCEQPTHEEG